MAHGTYQARDPRAQLNTLRSLPLFRHAATVFGAPVAPVTVLPTVPAVHLVEQRATALDLAQDALQRAENARHEARREYVAARQSLGLANRTSLPATRFSRVVPFTPEQVRARKATAFRAFNRSLAALRAADRQVAEALAGLDAARLAPVEVVS